jgi:hypothetical protein
MYLQHNQHNSHAFANRRTQWARLASTDKTEIWDNQGHLQPVGRKHFSVEQRLHL